VEARLGGLDRSFDDVVRSIEDVGNDDEHDPDGSTIAFERAQLMALRRAAVAELGELDAALTRLDDGTFGTCTGCGEPIAPERLDALPAASTCVSCAR
jgi:RNA polymerase-binding transcription factor DksA